MTRDKGNSVFRKVMDGTKDRTNTDAERKRNEELERQRRDEAKRLAQETQRIKIMMDKQARAEAAHQRAEEDRRKQQAADDKRRRNK